MKAKSSPVRDRFYLSQPLTEASECPLPDPHESGERGLWLPSPRLSRVGGEGDFDFPLPDPHVSGERGL
jgi:hypothetical protein